MFKKYKYKYHRLEFDNYNTEVLEVLYKKMSRDYLRFFGQMTKLYKRGDNKKKSLETIEKINRTLVFLNHVINGYVLTKDEASELFTLIDEINASRDYFISKSSENIALRERMEKISKETGVSAERLNLTQEHIRSGVSQAQRSRREGVSNFMKRTAPGTLGIGKNLLGGLGTALSGPFAPILGMAGTVVKDIWNVGKGVIGKIREHRERAIGSQLKPMAFGAESAGFGGDFSSGFDNGRLDYRRPYGRRKSRYKKHFGFRLPFGKSSQKRGVDLTDSLELFYDKKAYKAKWTKELLDNIKGLVKDSKKSSSSLLSWLGAGGLIAATAAGFYLIGNKIEKWFEKKTEPAVDAVQAAIDAANFEKQQREVQEELDLRKGYIGEKGWAKGLSAQEKKDKLAGARGYQKEFLNKQDVGLTLPKETNWDKLYRPDLPLPNSLPLHPPESMPWSWKNIGETFQDINKLSSVNMGKSVVGKVESEKVIENNTKLINSLDKLSQQLEKNRSASPVRGPSMGNVFDAADPLLNNFAAGKITLGGD